VIYAVVYIAALVAANLLVAWLGPWFSLVNAFVLIGLDLSLRDKLHDLWEGDKLAIKMGGLIATASIISYAINPATGMIAFNGSNTAGALVDSVVFPTIAFGGLMLEIVALQFIAKVGGGYIWSKILVKFK